MRLTRQPLPHQRAPLQFALEAENPFLAMAMRTGKTFVIARAIKKRGFPNGVLVCAPLTVLIPWAEELAKEEIPFYDLGDPAIRQSFHDTDGSRVAFYLVGPARLRQDPWILDRRWSWIVVDESTLMKNPKAQVTKLLNRYDLRVDNRSLLSGWPCPEGELDWFEQMRFVNHGSFMGCSNYWQFRSRYFKKLGYDWVPKYKTPALIKEALREKVFFLSAAQAGMPDRFIEEKRMVELSDKQRAIYLDVERDFAAAWEDKSLSTKWVPVKELRLHQIASGEVRWDDGSSTLFDAKLQELLWLFSNDLHQERRVVFFRFTQGVEAVSAALAGRGVAHRSITGATPQAKRKQAIDDYRSGRAKTLLLQADCGRYALDLSAGSVGIFYSLGHSFETFVQARQRFKHPLKKVSNLLIYLIAKGTVEEAILPTLQQKGMTGQFFFNRIYDSLLARRAKAQ